MPPRGLPPDAVEVEFDVQQERWSEYEVDGGRVMISGRAILLRLFKVGSNFAMKAQNVVSVKASEDLYGEPTAEPINTARKQQVAFDAISEPWNIYRTRGPDPLIIRTRFVASGIERALERFDAEGEPVYLVYSQTVMAPPVPDGNPATA